MKTRTESVPSRSLGRSKPGPDSVDKDNPYIASTPGDEINRSAYGKSPIETMNKARISPTMRFTLFIGAVCFASVAAIRA